MANTMTDITLPLLVGAIPTLREACPLLSVVNKDLNGAAVQRGKTIEMAVPVAQTAAAVTPAATWPTPTNVTPTIKSFAVDQLFATRFHLSTQDKANIANNAGFVPGQFAEAVRALANNVSAYVLGKYTAFYGYVGTAGTNPFASNVDTLADGDKILNDQNCPNGNRFGFISNASKAAALKLAAFNQSYVRGNNSTILTGEIGEQFGFRILRDSAIPTHTAGTASGVLINSGAVAIGDTSVAIDAGTGTLVVGDVFTVAGDTQTYTVTTAVADVSAGTLAFDPPAKVAWANNAAVTKKATHVVNLLADPAAFGLVMRVEESTVADPNATTFTDPETGIPLTITYNKGYHLEQWELSCLYGAGVLDARRGCRMAG